MPLLTGLSSAKPLTVGDLLKTKALGRIPGISTMIPDNPEIIYQPKYDRVNYPQTGVTTLNFFSTSKGQPATLITGGATGTRSKTYRDTNMDQVNVMSAKAFILYGIAIGYVPLGNGVASTSLLNFRDDVYRIASGSYMEMIFIDKPYCRLPLLFIPSPFEWKGTGAITTTATATTDVVAAPGGFGEGHPTKPFVFDPPYLIAPNENFTVTVYCDGTALNTGDAIDIYMALMGYEIRPAQ